MPVEPALLRTAALFEGLSDETLADLARDCERVAFGPGELLMSEGSVGESLYALLEGDVEITKRSGNGEVPLATLGEGEVVGEMAVLEHRPRNASARALGPVDAVRVPGDALLELIESAPSAALALLRTGLGRLRSTEALLRQREQLASLGTLSAGLAHELNNPAAALSRAVGALGEALAPPRSSPGTPPPANALERADRIDAVAELVADPDAAAALVDAGWDAETLASVPEEERGRLAAGVSVGSLVSEIKLATERISEIVGAVRDYTYLDRAPAGRVNVHDGLEKTLIILGHRLRQGMEVERRFAPDLPEIEAYGSELNQVWTNIIGNAIDATGGRGVLTITTERTDDGVRVRICNDGPEIPAEVRARIFEPFFTTKPPGVGTGLGLHISHSVVARHGGSLTLASRPGETCFSTELPATLPRRD
jgi:signal transduction histidine kinase